MAWLDCFWYDYNIKHLAANNVTPQEFQEVVFAARDFEISNSGTPTVRGKTSAGRYLICLFARIDAISILPVNAFEPTKGSE